MSSSLTNFNLPIYPNEPVVKYSKPYIEHDEPGLYHALGVLCFATATLLLGISIWNGYNNGRLLTIFGFFIGGVGQLVCGIFCYKYNYYIDGTVYFFFALNWSINTCFDLFPVFGWMEPLNGREYGFLNLMGCFFTFVFFIQNLNAPSPLTATSFCTTFLGFIFSTIGNFTTTRSVVKIGGIFNIITAALAYYTTIAMIINERFKRVYIPVLDGKQYGQKLD